MNNLHAAAPRAISENIGARLRQARLNANLTQDALAKATGLSRSAVIGAEAGRTTLETFVNILIALNLTDQINNLLPEQQVSPIQLAKLQGKKRQRASSGPKNKTAKRGDPEW